MFIDGTVIYDTGSAGATSFWQYGEFDTRFPGIDNPWAAGENIAPFDQEVSRNRYNLLLYNL